MAVPVNGLGSYTLLGTVPNLKPEQWFPAFLGVLAQTGNVLLSCKTAGVSRRTAYRYRQGNAEFAVEWALAMEDAGDALEAEARRRAVVGVETRKLILYKGEPVIDWNKPGQWLDDQGKPWVEGVSRGRKRWGGSYLYEVETKYSDSLLALLLKGARPDKYADRMRVDQGALLREAQRLSDELGVPLETLLAEVRQLQQGSLVP